MIAMMNTVLRFKNEIGWLLSLLAATLTVAIFQVTFGFGPIIAVPVGVLAFVSMFVVWLRVLNILEGPQPPARN